MALPQMSMGRNWLGKLFFLAALAWFASVFLVMRPDQPHVDPKPRPVVVLPDGTKHVVYLPYEIFGEQAGWVERIDVKTEYTVRDFLRRPIVEFVLIALGPIVTLVLAALGGLGVADWVGRRRSEARGR